jgi:hypothetical protein
VPGQRVESRTDLGVRAQGLGRHQQLAAATDHRPRGRRQRTELRHGIVGARAGPRLQQVDARRGHLVVGDHLQQPRLGERRPHHDRILGARGQLHREAQRAVGVLALDGACVGGDRVRRRLADHAGVGTDGAHGGDLERAQLDVVRRVLRALRMHRPDGADRHAVRRAAGQRHRAVGARDDAREAHRLEVDDAEDGAVGTPFHLRMLPRVVGRHARRRALEDVAVAGAGRRASELLRQEVGQRAVRDPSLGLGRPVLERRLLVAAAGDQHVVTRQRYPAARPHPARAARGCLRGDRRRGQLVDRPRVGAHAARLHAERVARDRGRMAGVDDQRDDEVRRPSATRRRCSSSSVMSRLSPDQPSLSTGMIVLSNPLASSPSRSVIREPWPA